MDTSDLQQRLKQLTQLLPSQRECLERLLFQLTFNQYQKFRIVGGAGSGKSVIALALAELFSDQFNVAILDNKTAPANIPTQLMQQWFNRPAQNGVSLSEQINSAVSVLPLLLIVDDADKLSSEVMSQLTQLDCLTFSFAAEDGANDDVTLLLNKLSSDDARQLLHSEHLNELELAQRLANADGNIYLLQQEPEKSTKVSPKQEAVVVKRYVTLVYVSTALVVIMALWWALSDNESSKINESTVIPPKTEIIVPASDTLANDALSTTETPADATSEMEPGTLSVETNSASSEPTTEDSVGAAKIADSGEENVVVDTVAETVTDTLGNKVELVAPSDALTAVEQTAAETITTPDNASFNYDEAALLAMNKQAYALQLAVLSSDAAIQRFKSAYPALPVLAYSRSWQGQPQLVLLLAAFEDKASAKAQIATLPAAIKATGPFIKPLVAIHNEINVRQSVSAGSVTD